jgi:hypothetical protein
VNQIPQTIGVDPNWYVAEAFDVGSSGKQHIQPFGRFSKATEYYFIILGQINGGKLSLDFFQIRFVLQPQRIRFPYLVMVLPKAEGAGARAFVR